MNRVHSSYAFTENEREKAKENRATYEEIKKKWRVLVREYFEDGADFRDYDLVISRKPKYCHSECTVLKNNTDLTEIEIALVCDGGNLVFGYRLQGKTYYINED